jgi:hypothetical protein
MSQIEHYRDDHGRGVGNSVHRDCWNNIQGWIIVEIRQFHQLSGALILAILRLFAFKAFLISSLPHSDSRRRQQEKAHQKPLQPRREVSRGEAVERILPFLSPMFTLRVARIFSQVKLVRVQSPR